jgi:glutathionylspermidine synthase
MERKAIEPRQGWQATIEGQGLIYWKTDLPSGEVVPYWNESAYYSLTGAEVYDLEATVRILMEMCVEAGDYMIENNLFADMGIPGWAVEAIKETWEAEPPMLYGRFDLAYGHDGVAKLLEFNADTPTSLIETAVQWHWVQDVFGDAGDQWNRLHEALVSRWIELAPRLPGDVLHMLHTSAEQSGEDFMTVGYLAETARQASLDVQLMPIEELGYDEFVGFVDRDGAAVRSVFKLYPWEWMLHEEFSAPMLERMGEGMGKTTWVEPIWKMLWSNKGLLPVLWRLFPDHPNLLPAYFESETTDKLTSFVRKPLLAREGANTTVVIDGAVAEEGPSQGYGEEGFIVQGYTDLGDYGGGRPVLGAWVVDMEPEGLGIRETDGLITDNLSRYVPHAIEG